jgi:subtilisin family serine protease
MAAKASHTTYGMDESGKFGRLGLMNPLDVVKLTALMKRSGGSPQIKIGLIDGPVVIQHPDLANEHIHQITGHNGITCTQVSTTACLHGTFIAGILCANRNSPAPAICPDCTLLVRPVFAESALAAEKMPSATPKELAAAIIECLNAGARLINLSLALSQPSHMEEATLEDALNQAARRGVIVVVAAGNQGTLGSSVITRHPWVIPVAACNLAGRPTEESNLGISIGRRGLAAPGDAVTSLNVEGTPITLSGTSVAVPFVTGTMALLWSEFPKATAAQLKFVITKATARRRTSVIPPLLDAAMAYQSLFTANVGN